MVAESDGRRARRQANREAVLDALAGLFREGVYEPSAAQVADRAGLSPRSLFRYFDDVHDLSRAAIDQQLAEAGPLLVVDARPEDPTDVKAERLVQARLRLFDAVGPAARAARVWAWRHPLVARQLAQSRAHLRHQLERLFAPELAAVGPDAAAEALAAVDALCSLEATDLLRLDQGLSSAQAAAAMTRAVRALLAPPPTTVVSRRR